MTDPIRVLIVDDDAFARSGMEMLISSAPDLVVVATCSNGAQVAGAIREQYPDVVLCDVRMPGMDGIAVVEALRGSGPAFLMMTAMDDNGTVLRAIEAGAAGFLLKDDDPISIVNAVRSVAAGDTPMSARSARHLVSWVRDDPQAARRRDAQARVEQLAPREREMAIAVATGASDAEIARQVLVAESTVKSTLATVRAKLGARTRVDLAVTVVRAGLV
ncbi:response regulator transcription factor [Microbacterium mitrae]|uniref:Response regulator transcription factor n=1 Tax=Microbacterium mitrae TaxID=664640 RepID=A0A5C8HU66_9MICO|nr:response regulator transcription factor [Microbacterium mitrae]TXK06581.1 response regulator transcription factor [Microbacterium mitrae]